MVTVTGANLSGDESCTRAIHDDSRIGRAWQALKRVQDPEIPAVSIVELGLIRSVRSGTDGAVEVALSPTYVGCPATEVIRESVAQALSHADIGAFTVRKVLSPAWSSDWITEEGRRKLQAYGIVPPDQAVSSVGRLMQATRPMACPRCDSIDTETLSEFGSTPCKALHRCRACREPFEYFKCI